MEEENPEITSLEDQLSLEENYYEFKYGLSSEFFENILNHEANLKEKFDPKIFFELINLYSKAIGYYESINDDKYKIYNQALIYLFEQPEAKKFMEGKDLAKLFRKKELMNKFKLCEKIVTEEKVKSFIDKKINEENILKSINFLYNNDMDNQKKYLEKKIKEKKLKYRDKRQQREEEKNQNENKINDEAKINKNMNLKEIKKEKSEEQFKIGDDATLNIDDEKKEKEKEDINQINAKSDDSKDVINNDEEENKENRNDDIESNNEKREKKMDLKQSIKLTNKTRFYEKISNNFDLYFNSYYDYFINNKLDLIINDFNLQSEQGIDKGCKSSVETLNQIKDMEYIMKDNNEDNYKNEIQKIIGELKAKQKKKIENILNEIDNSSNKINNKYSIDVSLFKEQFKLDITKLLNTYIFN